MNDARSVVMMGATGAVGGHAARRLLEMPGVERLTLLGRRPAEGLEGAKLAQHVVDVSDPESYRAHLAGHTTAVCTLGVGEPSKVTREHFVAIDKTAVLAFASACCESGVEHFELLSSVGVSSGSRSFYLRTKGELEDGLEALGFDRLSLFHPSMILTPTNRYGASQAVALAIWPLLRPVLLGGLRRFRGVPVETLGRAIAENVVTRGAGSEVLEWDRFMALCA